MKMLVLATGRHYRVIACHYEVKEKNHSFHILDIGNSENKLKWD